MWLSPQTNVHHNLLHRKDVTWNETQMIPGTHAGWNSSKFIRPVRFLRWPLCSGMHTPCHNLWLTSAPSPRRDITAWTLLAEKYGDRVSQSKAFCTGKLHVGSSLKKKKKIQLGFRFWWLHYPEILQACIWGSLSIHVYKQLKLTTWICKQHACIQLI